MTAKAPQPWREGIDPPKPEPSPPPPSKHSTQEPSMNPKDKIGITKINLHLVPPVSQIQMARVFMLVAQKYGAYNWRKDKVNATVYLSAMQRHLLAYQDGQNIDAESNISHLAHVAANAAILLDAISLDMLNDDRPTAGKAAQLIEQLARLTQGG